MSISYPQPYPASSTLFVLTSHSSYSDLPYFEEFLNLPSRSLQEYYQTIKHPLSIKKLQKLVKGIHGRKDNTGVSDFKSWAAFEERASLLWENAYFFNTDESDIFALAKELEVRGIRQYLWLSQPLLTHWSLGALQRAPQGGQGRCRRATAD